MNKPRILICPLDWGLGHAVRCVPIIRTIKKLGAIPVIAADNGPLRLLKKEFPEAEFVTFPGVSVSYPNDGGNMLWSMIKQSPALFQGIKDETTFIKHIIPALQIDAIISDNRFGAYSIEVPSVYITHQIHIQTGNTITDALARKQHAKYMKNFQQVWIPDITENDGISGKLSHGKNIPSHGKYIGLLSRFSTLDALEKKYDVACILSGPEPQRSLLEEIFIQQASLFPDKKFVLVSGNNESLKNIPAHIHQITLADAEMIRSIYASSENVVCRSGYTSIMEMVTVNRSAWLIPTPGQTEQEYLADYVDGKLGFKTMLQKHVDMQRIFDEKIDPQQAMQHPDVLRDTITDLLKTINSKKELG